MQRFQEGYFEITYDCNLRCEYCCVPPEQHEARLSESRIINIVSQAADLITGGITISGGEPFLMPLLVRKLCQIAVKRSLACCVLTNGTLIHQERIQRVIGNLNEIRVSLDDLKDPPFFRKGSNIEVVLANIRLLKNKFGRNLRLTVTTLIHDRNIDQLIEMYRQLVEIGVDRWLIGFISPRGRAMNRDISWLAQTEKMVQKISEMLCLYLSEDDFSMMISIPHLFHTADLSRRRISVFRLDQHPCDYYSRVLWITANDKIKYCPDLEIDLVDNIGDFSSIKEAIYASRQHAYLQLKVCEVEACLGCRYISLCGTGCRANSLLYFGSIYRPDPVSCAFRVYWEKYILPMLPTNSQRAYKRILKHDGFVPSV